MNTLETSALKKDMSFTGDLYIDSTFLFLPRNADLNEQQIKALEKWQFTTLLCEGDVDLGGNFSTGVDLGETENTSLSEINKDDSSTKINDSIKKAIENSKKTVTGNSDKARMEMVEEVYKEYLNYIESVFTHYATHKKINQEDLEESVQELCIFTKEHRRYILRVNPTVEETGKNFLIVHTMRTTVLALAIGFQLHLPLSKMIELGVTCIIHEIGMLKLPPQLYMSKGLLTPGEKAQISKHTVLGYTIAKELNFPLSMQLGILEHHEKENGTGYPRKLTGDQISSMGKIISVACSYEAMTSPRAFRKGKDSYDSITELIKNEKHAYDTTVLKGLLYALSLYPIGSYVYLSNRKIAEVIDSNPDEPKNPVVQMLTEFENDGSQKIIQTGKDGITVLRVLSPQEKKDMLKAIEEKYAAIRDAQEELESEEKKNPSAEKIAATSSAAEFSPAATSSPVATNSPAATSSPVAGERATLETVSPAEKSDSEEENSTAAKTVQSNETPTVTGTESDGTEIIDLSFFN